MHVNAIKVIDYLLNNEWKISTFFQRVHLMIFAYWGSMQHLHDEACHSAGTRWLCHNDVYDG